MSRMPLDNQHSCLAVSSGAAKPPGTSSDLRDGASDLTGAAGLYDAADSSSAAGPRPAARNKLTEPRRCAGAEDLRRRFAR